MDVFIPHRIYHADGRLAYADQIMVFGSNVRGRHGAGAALQASITHGAIEGIGEGLVGNSYAIPTREQNTNNWIVTRALNDVVQAIERFVDFTYSRNDLEYFVTAVGCGRAGFTKEVIAPLFRRAVNCSFPLDWKSVLDKSDLELFNHI